MGWSDDVRVGATGRGRNGNRVWITGPIKDILPMVVVEEAYQNPAWAIRMIFSFLVGITIASYIVFVDGDGLNVHKCPPHVQIISDCDHTLLNAMGIFLEVWLVLWLVLTVVARIFRR